MIDTFFLVAGKKKVIFLHWFHHTSVMWFCWFAWGTGTPMGVFFAMMNLTVHSIMYAWYALAAANNWIGTGLKPTKGFSQTVTIMQIIQMVLGASLTFYVLLQGDSCDNEKYVVYMALAMYSVYLILFVHFFIRAYCKKRKPLLKTPEFAVDAKLLDSTCAHCGMKRVISKKPAGSKFKKRRKNQQKQRKN